MHNQSTEIGGLKVLKTKILDMGSKYNDAAVYYCLEIVTRCADPLGLPGVCEYTGSSGCSVSVFEGVVELPDLLIKI